MCKAATHLQTIFLINPQLKDKHTLRLKLTFQLVIVFRYEIKCKLVNNYILSYSKINIFLIALPHSKRTNRHCVLFQIALIQRYNIGTF